MEVTANSIVYLVGKMSTFKQLHVSRKLAPLMGTMVRVKSSGAELNFENLAMPIAAALATMKDEEVESIIGDCLSAVQRKIPGGLGYAPVWNADAKSLQFEDIGLREMMQLVHAVIMDNLGGFLPESLA